MKSHRLFIVASILLTFFLPACQTLSQSEIANTPTSPVATIIPTPPAAALEARRVLADMLSQSPDAIKIVSFEEVEWSDSCLGVNQLDVMCAQVITPGYRVILKFQNDQYEFHTDESGRQVILAMQLP